MSFRINSHVWLFFCLLLISISQAQSEPVSPGAMLSNSCAGCHGTDGRSPGAIPSINGKTALFIAGTLKEFRSGTRPSTVMGRHAKGYSDDEIQLIAEFFAGQK